MSLSLPLFLPLAAFFAGAQQTLFGQWGENLKGETVGKDAFVHVEGVEASVELTAFPSIPFSLPQVNETNPFRCKSVIRGRTD